MGVIARQSFKGTFVGYFGALLGGITLVFIQPYFLSQEVIGLTRVMFNFASLFALFSQCNITNAIIKYHAYFEKGQRRKILFRLMILVPFLGFLIISILVFCFKNIITGYYSEKSSLFMNYFYLIFPFTLIIMYLGIFEIYSTTLNRITIPKFFRDIVIRILTIIAILIFFYYQLSINTFVYFYILTFLVAAIGNMIYSFKLTDFNSALGLDSSLDKKFYKQIGVYMFFAFLASLGANIVVTADSIMIGSMLGLDKAGLYAIVFYIASMVEIPSKTTLMISGPNISRDLVTSNLSKVDEVYKKNTLNQSIIGGLLLILLLINIDNLFQIMPKGKSYQEGEYVIIFIAFAKLYDSVTGINNQIIMYSKYYKLLVVYALIMAVLVIGGNYFLIPLLGITGAAVSSFAGYFFINTISIIFIYFKFGIQPFKKQIWLVLGLYLICFIINYFIPTLSNHYLDVLLRSSIITIIFATYIYKLNVSPDLNQLVLKIIRIKGFKDFLQGK